MVRWHSLIELVFAVELVHNHCLDQKTCGACLAAGPPCGWCKQEVSESMSMTCLCRHSLISFQFPHTDSNLVKGKGNLVKHCAVVRHSTAAEVFVTSLWGGDKVYISLSDTHFLMEVRIVNFRQSVISGATFCGLISLLNCRC